MNTLDQIEPTKDPDAIEPDKYPSLVVRYQAMFADVMVIIGLMLFAGYVLKYLDHPPDWLRMALFFGIVGVYEPLCISFGATVGHLIMKTRVRQYGEETKRINIFMALIRYVFKLLLGVISFLTLSSNEQRRAIHDMASGSVVVNLSYLKKSGTY